MEILVELAECTREKLVFDKQRLLTPVSELGKRIDYTKGKFGKWGS